MTLRFEDFDHLRVQVGDVELHCRVGGSGPALVLLHGWPQHSLMWHAVAPVLAQHWTVVAPDQRGAGASSVGSGGYDKTTMAADLAGLLDRLGHRQVLLAGYDLGAGVAAAFARDYPDRVRGLAVMEFGLAGFGYEQMMTPSKDWRLESNWHLALFTVPEAAEWLCRGRERELLAWFFHHVSYAGNSAVSNEHFEAYVRELTKPGTLRAGIECYATVWRDAEDNAVLRSRQLPMPVLALGGEASAGPVLGEAWAPIATDLRTVVIERAGHWLGDENPVAVAAALTSFFAGIGA